jgi:hypothetical protein
VAHIQHPLWCHPLGNIFHESKDGWKSYLNIHSCDPLDENVLDNGLLKFLWKEGPFARKATNLRDPMLAHVFWWERFERHVPKLQALALRALSQDYSSSMCECN